MLDNESYETTGDQDTTSPRTDFKSIAKACGYAAFEEVHSEKALLATAKKLLSRPGPAFLRIKINRLPTHEIPRISSKYDSIQIAKNFRQSIF